MGNKYVNVTITRETQAVSVAGFGMPLILGTSKLVAYKEYEDLATVGVDYGTGSKEYALAAKTFGQTPRPATVAMMGIVYGNTPSELTTALNTLILSNNDWYFLLSTADEDADIAALAAWTDAYDKLYFATTKSKTLGATLNAQNTVLMVMDSDDTYAGAAWVGRCAPLAVGSFTWTFKTLSGVNPATFNTTDINTIEDNNASTYIREGGVNITSHGVTTSGDYIDIIQSQHYLTARITENVFGLMTRLPKIPFTDGGIALVVAEVEKTLKEAFAQGMIADEAGKPLFKVEAPSRDEISANDKANRKLPNVKFSVTLAGAIEDADFNGVLSL